jgi:dimethylamine monooxygenase subunit A
MGFVRSVVLPVVGPAFRIGVQPLEPAQWLVVSDRLEAYQAEKAALMAAIPEEVFAAEDGTHDAQGEALERVAAFTSAHLGFEIPPAPAGEPPLQHAARFIEDDLVLMRNGATGWRLAAGSLCFPSGWRLREKFGHPLDVVHAPVPAFGTGTRNATLIARMFDNLAVGQPVIRANWSIYPDDALHHPSTEGEQVRIFDPAKPVIGQAFFRSERQTLLKLPRSGDILFTIRIGVERIAELVRRGDGAKLADALAAMTPEERAYKGMTIALEPLVRELRAAS